MTRLPKACIGMPKDASAEIMKKGMTSLKGCVNPLRGSGTFSAKVGYKENASTIRKSVSPPARRVASRMSR